ncbi:kinesin KIF13B isoform X5 [Micractinium conductrix]|uniref:Kinesin KIF13B isoform X5 n=1 Tax=Micractinium conductrix TaxID=554055 RepID=A0A2P6V0X6_9CHLO|nr:kinesin KIF13B isoform X5 [Micractinium conductrix]|eukprot:PSC67735.1 kinesin KIF13B isoform X5 [Micractinium conductrix]
MQTEQLQDAVIAGAATDVESAATAKAAAGHLSAIAAAGEGSHQDFSQLVTMIGKMVAMQACQEQGLPTPPGAEQQQQQLSGAAGGKAQQQAAAAAAAQLPGAAGGEAQQQAAATAAAQLPGAADDVLDANWWEELE